MMKKIIDYIPLNKYAGKAFDLYFKDRSFAVFDIETTGLSPLNCKVILSGFLLFTDEGCRAVQFFSDQADDEKEVLENTIAVLQSVDYVITYNGKHFDLPFIKKRAEKHHLKFNAEPYNLDLYLIVSGHSPLREVMPNLKQKSLEIFMGLSDSRDDEISGGESVELYHRYMETHAFDLERKILLHNHDDIIQLFKLLPVLAKADLHSAMFKMGFMAGNYTIQRIYVSERNLHVLGRQNSDPIDYICFPTEERPYSLIMDSSGCDMELIIPCQFLGGAVYFDAQAILGKQIEALKKYPNVENGYLIVQNQSVTSCLEINAFLIQFLSDVL